MSAVNEYHTNVYERITDIMYLLYEADGISVCGLASKYQLPPETILEDLKYMLESEALNIFLFPYEEELDTDEFSEELLHGKHNDVRLYAERTDDDYMVSLQLSSFEKIFLHGFLQAHDPEGKFYETQEIFMKHTPEETSGEVLQMIRQIKEAIHGHFRLLINARTKEGIRTMEVVPAEIVKMVSDGSCYCMARSSDKFVYIRLDKVERIRILSKDRQELPEKELEQEQKRFAYRWGMRGDDGPFCFAMIVYEEANLPNRLYRELENRINGKWTKQKEGTWLYEDMVIDYESLKQWVLELGSSVRVRKPLRLAEEIRREAYQRLALYEEQV